MDASTSYLTGTGYEELYGIGQRIREKYSYLLTGKPDKFYFRPTNEQRTITSCVAFVHGFTDNTNLSVTIEEARQRDDVIRVSLTVSNVPFFPEPKFYLSIRFYGLGVKRHQQTHSLLHV